MPRFIGIRHRVKKTATGEARPTQVAIETDGELNLLELENEDAELDFAIGRLPTDWQDATWSEAFIHLPHHLRKKLKADAPKHSDDPNDYTYKVPSAYDGLQSGDTVGMVLGGSGDNLAYALSRRASIVNARIMRIPPFVLKDQRTDTKKDGDAELLMRLVAQHPELFYHVSTGDEKLILLREAMRARTDAMKARIACEQRLRQQVIGRAFRAEGGLFPEGNIENFYDKEKANDKILQALSTEESRRERDVSKSIEELDVYQAVFSPIEGCGVMIAGRLISAIQDIRRFWVQPDQAAIDRLRVEAEEFKLRGNFDRDTDKVADRVTAETTKFQILQMVRSWKFNNGLEAEAELLNQAIACYQQIHRLKRNARNKGCAKLRRYCGTFVMPDGIFPRRRAGTVANWSGECRQALYLLGDQFNRRPGSVWGKKLLANKQIRRQIHPEALMMANGDGKQVKRYTNGHIHNQARWTTVAQFVNHIFSEWTRLELQRSAPTAEVEMLEV